MSNSKNKNTLVLKILQCPNCQAKFIQKDNHLFCLQCDHEYQLLDGKILFTDFPEDINPSEARERGSGKDTKWRQENTRFLQGHLKGLKSESLILDVGAGRGDFQPYYANFPHLLLDVYPYPETDIVCDLTQINPFRSDSIDVVLLMNVLEHIYKPYELLKSIHAVLKPGGKIFITIPFLLKIHQSPLDFQRLTHFSIKKMVEELGFEIKHFNGVYDNVGLIQEAIRYYQFWELPRQKRQNRLINRFLLGLLKGITNLLIIFSKKINLKQPFETNNPAPIGYQLIIAKNPLKK